jgi:sugar phosphate isomerase/epimerase
MLDMSRRAVLAGSLAGAAMSASRAMSAPAAPFFARTGLPLGLQLYTLGPDLAADPAGMLGKVAQAGYRTVELAGYAGKKPAELRALLDKAGLAAASSHVGAASNPAQAGLDNLDGVIAEAKVMGAKHIVLPMFAIPERIKPGAGEDRRAFLTRLGSALTADDWKATAALLNAKVGPLKAAGLTLGYHNHNVEFAPVGSTTGLEILLKEAHPDVQFEMDAGWVAAAGHDPLAHLKAHPMRLRQMQAQLRLPDGPGRSRRGDHRLAEAAACRPRGRRRRLLRRAGGALHAPAHRGGQPGRGLPAEGDGLKNAPLIPAKAGNQMEWLRCGR